MLVFFINNYIIAGTLGPTLCDFQPQWEFSGAQLVHVIFFFFFALIQGGSITGLTTDEINDTWDIIEKQSFF